MQRKIVAALAALTDAHQKKIREAAEAHGFVLEVYPCAQAAVPYVADAEIILSNLPEPARHAPLLRWFCASNAGVEPFLKPGVFASRDAVLSNSSGAYGVTIAEHIIMVTLEMMRRQAEYNKIVADRAWKRDLPIRSIKNSRVTLVGTGDIGSEAVKRLRAFGPAGVTGVNRRGANPGNLYDRIVTIDAIDTVLPETDLLIISLPGTPETAGLISAERIALLPRDAFLVNVGRGSVLDQEALVKALREGRLAGAALDVFTQEPPAADDPVWDCPGLLFTPHIAGNTTLPYTLDRIVDLFLEDFENYCSGRPLKRMIDRSRGY